MKRIGLKGSHVLVTGASGFVGRHLTEELKRRGAEVVALDLQGESQIDIQDWQQVKGLVRRIGKLDLVYHLAALIFVPYSLRNPREIYNVNVLGTLNILELCRVLKVKRVVFASSYIYGPPRYLPVDEEHPLNPTNPYARSKVMGEDLCRAYHKDYKLRFTILRLFNLYGEGQSDSFLIPSILKQLTRGSMELMDPEPRRDFLYISDAIEAYIKAGEYSRSNLDIFNIGSGISYSVKEIVDEVVGLWGQGVNVSYQNQRRKDEIMDSVADIRKAKRQLGWEPEVQLKEGLKKYIRWYRAQPRVSI